MEVEALVVLMGWIVGASASVIFHCTIKSRRWHTVVEAVDEGCPAILPWVGRMSIGDVFGHR